MTRRHSFTLAEVLISLIVVGGAFCLFLPAIRSTTGTFRTMQKEIYCQYLADEYFSRTVIQCLSKDVPKDLNTISNDFVVEIDRDKYFISTRLSPAEDEINKEKETSLISLKVSVSYNQINQKQNAIRETKLCVAPQK